jgi:uncharacterized membrane protein YgcG
MKSFLLTLTIAFLTITLAFGQSARPVSGTIVDSTKLTLPGSSVRLVSNGGDSTGAIANMDGKFSFPAVKGTSITLTISSIGYQTLKRTYNLGTGTEAVQLGQIILASQSKQLNAVTIVGVNPVLLKQDTVQYNMNAYKVRENAPLEDALKKMPGVDVDKDGNVTTQGKSVTRVRVNGKDFMGGDLKTATRNLPANMIENVQVVDDYGDQANLTGVKTGDPEKILNITIRPDRNKGYFGQATLGDGSDGLPKPQNNDNRYVAAVTAFIFNNNRQVSILGNLNNTNVNTFSFGSGAAGGGGNRGGGNFGGGGGGGGRGNALRGSSNGQTVNANGINTSRSIGANYRDQLGKYVTLYGSYSFSDNTTNTLNNVFQQNNTGTNNTQRSSQEDNILNHRFNLNLEYKPDTVNYLKVTPTISYSRTVTDYADNVGYSQNNAITRAYTSTSYSESTAPNYNINALYNHRFNSRGRNFSINGNLSSSKNEDFDNPIYQYTIGQPSSLPYQRISTDSRTNTVSSSLSYLEPIAKRSYLEINYALSHAKTTSDKETLAGNTEATLSLDPLQTNDLAYTFTTNRVGLNYRFVESKYNYTLGLGVQPTVLDGNTLINGQNINIHNSTVNFVPTANFRYNFSRSQSFNLNYGGTSNQPSFSQLQPVLDRSNALYPVKGNSDLNPEFTNNLQIRYNKFSFETGNVFFTNFSLTQTNNKIATDVVNIDSTYNVDTRLRRTQLTRYQNASGYYQASAFAVYSKPWAQRKYTLFLDANVAYSNNVGYVSTLINPNLDATDFSSTTSEKNIGHNWVIAPRTRFRVDITDRVDSEVGVRYSINKTDNSLKNTIYDNNANIRQLDLTINGKAYFWKDWTLSYDFTRTVNSGYKVAVTNPNILNLYIERRFLKQNMATIRLQGFDLFNQNTGFSINSTSVGNTQTQTNRLARYFLLSFTMRLQKFAGKAPNQQGEGRMRMRDGGGNGPGGGGPGGPGGPSGM